MPLKMPEIDANTVREYVVAVFIDLVQQFFPKIDISNLYLQKLANWRWCSKLGLNNSFQLAEHDAQSVMTPNVFRKTIEAV